MIRVPRLSVRSCLALGFLTLSTWASSRAQSPRPGPQRPGETPEQAVVRGLDEAWPDHPEWLDEYTAILQGTGLGPNDGWHRRAVAQTRFDWKSVSKRLD